MILVLTALIGCSGTVLEGRVVDGLSGQPAAGVDVLATATEAAGMSCMSFGAKTGDDGRFRIEGACAVPYQLKPSGEDRWFTGDELIPAGAAAPVEVVVWNNPSAPGVYRLAGGVFEPLRTAADLQTRTVTGTTEKVDYPSELPTVLPLIAAGEHLVIVGKDDVASLAPAPLLNGPEVRLDEGDTVVTKGPWTYIGARITDGVVTRETAAFDAAKVKKQEKGERAVAFVPADALPPGRYALRGPDDRRVYVVDFGTAGTSPIAPPTPAPGAEAPGEAPPGAPPN